VKAKKRTVPLIEIIILMIVAAILINEIRECHGTLHIKYEESDPDSK